METLHSWSLHHLQAMISELGMALRDPKRGCHSETALRACDLIAWLLQPLPKDRPRSFDDVLAHSFFAGRDGTWKMSEMHVSVAVAGTAGYLAELEEADGATRLRQSILSKDHLLGLTPLHQAAVSLQQNAVHNLLSAANGAEAECVSASLGTKRSDIAVASFGSQGEGLRFASSMKSRAHKAKSLLNECVNALDSQNNTALHALLKAMGHGITLSEPDLHASTYIIEILAELTDPSIKDASGRTAYDVGRISPNQGIRGIFGRQVAKKRCALFCQTVLCMDETESSEHSQTILPWGLGKGDLQEWLRKEAGRNNKDSLKTLLDAMGEVDGLTILNEWVDVGFNKEKANCGKLNEGRIKKQLKLEGLKKAGVQKLANLLGELPLGKQAVAGVLRPGGLSFHKALLQSCEQRSLLTDFIWIKQVGEGAFGRAHLCK